MDTNTTDTDIKIDKGHVSQMPPALFAGEIRVVDRIEDVAGAIGGIAPGSVVGFDTETKPTFKKGFVNTVSLMQVSTDDTCLLIRLNRTGLTAELRGFLEDESIVKIGLSLKDDFNALHRLGQFEPRSFVDLQQLARTYHIGDSSLQKIYAIIFGHRISKSQRLTNWDADTLTRSQCLYASTDAWACLRIYRTLLSGAFNPEAARKAIAATSVATAPGPGAPDTTPQPQ